MPSSNCPCGQDSARRDHRRGADDEGGLQLRHAHRLRKYPLQQRLWWRGDHGCGRIHSLHAAAAGGGCAGAFRVCRTSRPSGGGLHRCQEPRGRMGCRVGPVRGWHSRPAHHGMCDRHGKYRDCLGDQRLAHAHESLVSRTPRRWPDPACRKGEESQNHQIGFQGAALRIGGRYCGPCVAWSRGALSMHDLGRIACTDTRRRSLARKGRPRLRCRETNLAEKSDCGRKLSLGARAEHLMRYG